MKFYQVLALATAASAFPSLTAKKPLVDPDVLEKTIKGKNLLAKSQILEDFAYSYPERNRVIGSKAHNKTVNYIYKTLKDTGYYNVVKQPFSAYASQGVNATLKVQGVDYDAGPFDFSPNGTVRAPLVTVADLGCNRTDYDDAALEGNIALISRGTCEFGLKSAYARQAGAIGAIIYNNVEGNLTGTLGGPDRPEAPYVPTVGITQEQGLDLVDRIAEGTVTSRIHVLSFYNIAYTNNVIAETKGGDHKNVFAMGAHTDSVAAGPGINDDGSGTVGILETALQLTKYKTKNAVRFGFWSGEEEGLLGSYFYTDSLTPKQLAKVRLYLNYDMIASPNYIYAIYDGDGSAFNITGPKGSGKAEKLYEKYFDRKGLNHVPTEFDGRSDYDGFLQAGVPCGGLFTGAEQIKTKKEAKLFGGEAGVATDINYHGAGDNVQNLNMTAFRVNTKAIAYFTGFYGLSFDKLGTSPNTKREIEASVKEPIVRKQTSRSRWV